MSRYGDFLFLFSFSSLWLTTGEYVEEDFGGASAVWDDPVLHGPGLPACCSIVRIRTTTEMASGGSKAAPRC